MTKKEQLTRCTQCNTYLSECEPVNEWWKKCEECGQFYFLYEPMPHQAKFHRDPARFKFFAGGFGSSKSTTVAAEFVMLALKTPNGVGLVGAATYPQLERTSKKQVLDMIPQEFVGKKLNQKDNVITLINGYEIMFRSFDDEQKLRSLNLCHVLMEEANGTDYSIFVQLQTRLRHHATKDHKILISSNPDVGWVRTELLLRSQYIYGSKERITRKPEDINPNISTHISRTEQNIHLPDGYIDSLKIGKQDWWVARYLEGSFSFAEGAVYPNFPNCIVDDITVDEIKNNVRTKGWHVLGGADFGLVDPTVLILIAIDPVNGIAYAYDEYYKNNLPVAHHAKEMKRKMDHIPLGSLRRLVGDPSGARRNINDRRSIFNHYAEYGIFFEKGDNRIDAGIMKVYSYIEMGKFKVLSHMANTIEEMTNYHYKPVEMGETPTEKPVDKDNHVNDCIRYILQTLPDDPDQLKSVTYGAGDFRSVDSQAHLPFELRTDDTDYYNNSPDSWMGY